jgi:hypothetical protein
MHGWLLLTNIDVSKNERIYSLSFISLDQWQIENNHICQYYYYLLRSILKTRSLD